MFRGILMTLAFAVVACARDDGPTKLSAPGDANFTSSVNNPGEGGALNADDVVAEMVVRHSQVKTRECDGPDGHYAESRNVFTGTSTGDPRLSGVFEFAMIYDMLTFDEFKGPDIANITIRDPATGRVKAEGTASSWGKEDWLQGAIVGVVRDEGGGSEETTGSGQWIANFRIQFGNGAVISIGGTAPPGKPAAGIFSGGCPGVKWTEFEFDVGGAGLSALSTTAPAGAQTHRSGM